ncbi:MAG: hypothetical protein WAW39_16655 [Prosthecobacter sp.]|uniref:hypothetical protein n=1 Tax=Prosthecobacter sp. TaxID=1965333 RepID=UPI003BB1847D
MPGPNQSPVRQRILQAQSEIAKVWQNRLQKHLFQMQQEANKQAGIEGGSDPLGQSPLAQLKAGGGRRCWGGEHRERRWRREDPEQNAENAVPKKRLTKEMQMAEFYDIAHQPFR